MILSVCFAGGAHGWDHSLTQLAMPSPLATPLALDSNMLGLRSIFSNDLPPPPTSSNPPSSNSSNLFPLTSHHHQPPTSSLGKTVLYSKYRI